MKPRTREFIEKLRDLMGEYGAEIDINGLQTDLRLTLRCDEKEDNWEDVDVVTLPNIPGLRLQYLTRGYWEIVLRQNQNTPQELAQKIFDARDVP